MGLPLQTSEALNHQLNLIADLFKPGAKLTLLVRSPKVEGDADVMMTNDSFEEIIEAVNRRRNAVIAGETG